MAAPLHAKRGIGVSPLDAGGVECSHPSYDVTQSGSFSFRNYKLTTTAVETERGPIEQLVDLSTLDMESARPLGSGSSGRVLEVVHRPTGGVVAVKRIPISEKRQRDEIQKELLMLQQNHPYVVRVYGAFFDAKGYILIPMEKMDGSLADAIRLLGDGDADVGGAALLAVAKQALLGLRYLHEERRMMHRDIKPANLLLNRDGAVKISDFGVAKESSTYAGASTFVGTQYFMSPERLKGEAYSFSCDVWSLGLSLVQCGLSSHTPAHQRSNPWVLLGISESSTFFDLLAVIDDGRVPQLPIACGEDARDLVARCLAVVPEQRPDAATLLRHAWLCDATETECTDAVAAWVRELCRRAAGGGGGTPPAAHGPPRPTPFSPEESPALDPGPAPAVRDMSPGFHGQGLDTRALDSACGALDQLIGKA